MEDYEGKLSDCCGADIIYHDICSECKEHCDTMEEDYEDKNEYGR